ncbi:hypothetical protein [Bacillus sp. AK128]
MLTVNETLSFFKQEVKGIIDPIQVWTLFKEFGKIPIENEDDIELLFQCGMDDEQEEPYFYIDFIRQFTIYDEEEYSHMEQFHCQLLFEPTEYLQGLSITEWYFETEGDLDDYFLHIENLDEFKHVIQHQPVKIRIYQEEI